MNFKILLHIAIIHRILALTCESLEGSRMDTIGWKVSANPGTSCGPSMYSSL